MTRFIKMEEIKRSGSPAQLIAADEEDGESITPPVRFHEAENAGASADNDDDYPEPEQLSAEEKEERRQLLRKVGRYCLLFPKEISDINVSNLDALPSRSCAISVKTSNFP